VRLSVMIVESDSTSAEALRRLLYSEEIVLSVDVVLGLKEASASLGVKTGVNAIMIDIFSFEEPTEATDWIFYVRETYPDIVFCLYSDRKNLREMAGLPETTQKRLTHYYQLAKDLLATRGQRNLEDLKDRLASLDDGQVREHAIEEVDRIIRDTRSGLEIQRVEFARSRKNFAPFVFVDAKRFEDLVLRTLDSVTKGLTRASYVNTIVLALGGLLIVGAFLTSAIRGSWEAVAFGGMGLGGIIAALVTNPISSIGAEARKLVQIQVAYIGFLSEVQLYSDLAGQSMQSDVHVRLGQESERIIKLLSEV
jgi:hypothetical protein